MAIIGRELFNFIKAVNIYNAGRGLLLIKVYEGAKTYSSVDDLLDAFDKANLSEADISVLERKLRSQMGAGKGK